MEPGGEERIREGLARNDDPTGRLARHLEPRLRHVGDDEVIALAHVLQGRQQRLQLLLQGARAQIRVAGEPLTEGVQELVPAHLAQETEVQLLEGVGRDGLGLRAGNLLHVEPPHVDVEEELLLEGHVRQFQLPALKLKGVRHLHAAHLPRLHKPRHEHRAQHPPPRHHPPPVSNHPPPPTILFHGERPALLRQGEEPGAASHPWIARHELPEWWESWTHPSRVTSTWIIPVLGTQHPGPLRRATHGPKDNGPSRRCTMRVHERRGLPRRLPSPLEQSGGGTPPDASHLVVETQRWGDGASGGLLAFRLGGLQVLPDAVRDVRKQRVGNGHGEVVLGDLPKASLLHEHTRAPARAHVRRVEHLIEPSHRPILGEDEVARHRPEAPRLAAREVRLRPGPERVPGPPLGGIRAQEDALGGEVAKVARLVRLGGGLVPVIEHGGGRSHLGNSRSSRRGGHERQTDQSGNRHGWLQNGRGSRYEARRRGRGSRRAVRKRRCTWFLRAFRWVRARCPRCCCTASSARGATCAHWRWPGAKRSPSAASCCRI
ncbi:hypothetical protein STIAU_8547 [Stigmatella aurantiaca DW4/3-1]|uniref:Uncharacterized protein n=1 Tax=Stigmatella aurantiaca (strain DW4/3-1) TaxID=378806 RepID=Q09AN0_STIAD|nr:hypothetical protein STIAU_8547 [Stigmatella aurantiaca DW4/3-1]